MTKSWTNRLMRLLASALIIALVTVVAYFAHAKSFVAGFLYLFPIMLIAFGWGLIDASTASVLAVGCLDYFFTEPLFHFYMADPQDWVALVSFEAVVLLVSQLADRLKRHAFQSAQQYQQAEKLYLMSRDVLSLDRSDTVGSQLVHLIVNAFELSSASLWDAREARVDSAGPTCIPEDEVRGTLLHHGHFDDEASKRFLRALLVGSRAIGAIGILGGSSNKIVIDGRTADAIASLAALALERSHSFRAESEAEAARQSEQLRSALLDGLAHAFKTPLSTIQAASSGLLEIGSLTPAQQDLVSLINQESVRLGDLTTQALETARIDGDRLDVKKEQVFVQALFEDISEHYSHYFSGHQLHVQNDTHNTFVWADGRLLRLALLELVDNASKYADPRAPIRLSASCAGLEVSLSVQNEGSYIDPHERRRIFRRFYRSPGSQHRAPGTGIGLSFVKRIAEAHSGHVWVESEATTGTTFFLALPISAKEIQNGHKHGARSDR
jgi:two-component system, OmpR family, sensor histidine kinase KdpD